MNEDILDDRIGISVYIRGKSLAKMYELLKVIAYD